MLPEARAYLHDIEQATVLIDRLRQGKRTLPRNPSVAVRSSSFSFARLTVRNTRVSVP
jgi:hypothetical protein